jgi:6-pyruvoyltetrahydropterin/6-carboxytetrahydropterin synthase
MDPAGLRVRKEFDDFPCAHRSWAHDGRCRFVHGYARSFVIDFACDELDPATGFVVDFGQLRDVHALLAAQFDHTTVVAADDPELELFEQLADKGLVDLRVMTHSGMEGAADWVFRHVDELIGLTTGGRVRVVRVEARESTKNAVVLDRAH